MKDFELLIELLKNKQYKALRDKLAEMNPVDISLFFEDISMEQVVVTFRTLPKDLANMVFAELDIEKQHLIVESITDNELSNIIEDLFVDDAVDMLEELPAKVVKRVLRNATHDTRDLINQFLNYPENSAGSIMTAEYINLRPSMTVAEAIAYIRKHGEDRETVYTCYVIDPNRVLIGLITVRKLLLSDDNQTVSDIMDDTDIIYATTTEDRETVAALFTKYGFLSIPIVDHEKRLVGIVTVDDILDVIEAEATEDIEKMAAILPSEKPYLKTSIWETFKKRIPWLLLLMVSATFTGKIIANSEAQLAAYVALTNFIPMLMDTGGNAGGQSSVTIIRSLSLNDIEFSDILKIIWKETRVAFLCGFSLAVVGFFKIMLIDKVSVYVALVVCLTLFVVVLLAKITGCILPLLSSKLGFDPAVMASPIITTIVDAVALIIYFRTATFILKI